MILNKKIDKMLYQMRSFTGKLIDLYSTVARQLIKVIEIHNLMGQIKKENSECYKTFMDIEAASRGRFSFHLLPYALYEQNTMNTSNISR